MPVAKLEAFEATTVELSRFARALSHPARIAILTYLRDQGESPCMKIVDSLPLSQPACSRHVNELLKAGLLTSRAAGSQIYFSLSKARIRHFCEAFGTTLK
jgi:DNA-binding transcriptional ArsR family regulator